MSRPIPAACPGSAFALFPANHPPISGASGPETKCTQGDQQAQHAYAEAHEGVLDHLLKILLHLLRQCAGHSGYGCQVLRRRLLDALH